MHRTLHKSEATALRRKKSGGPRGGATPLEKRYFIILESIELDLLPPSWTSLHTISNSLQPFVETSAMKSENWTITREFAGLHWDLVTECRLLWRSWNATTVVGVIEYLFWILKVSTNVWCVFVCVWIKAGLVPISTPLRFPWQHGEALKLWAPSTIKHLLSAVDTPERNTTTSEKGRKRGRKRRFCSANKTFKLYWVA